MSPDDRRLLPPDASLFDFVDPFADVDLLVPRASYGRASHR